MIAHYVDTSIPLTWHSSQNFKHLKEMSKVLNLLLHKSSTVDNNKLKQHSQICSHNMH
jgi:hypothetical protein